MSRYIAHVIYNDQTNTVEFVIQADDVQQVIATIPADTVAPDE